MTTITFNRLPQSIAIAAGKGGVGKTTITATLACIAASRAIPTVAIDLDPQANLATVLGVPKEGDFDHGRSFVGAAQGFIAPTLISTGRPNLSMIAGGEELNSIANLVSRDSDIFDISQHLCAKIAEVVDPRAWIFIDSGPASGSALTDIALTLAQHLVITTEQGATNVDGVETLVRRCNIHSYEGHQLISPVGIVRFRMAERDTAINATADAAFEQRVQGVIPMFNTSIRYAKKAAFEAEEYGIVATEYAHLADSHNIPYYEYLKRGEKPVSFASNAQDLSNDYRQLADEITERITNGPTQ